MVCGHNKYIRRQLHYTMVHNYTETDNNGTHIIIKQIFLNVDPDVYVTCETCGGARYNRETLEIKFKEKTIKKHTFFHN